jgi:hypothetical protein
MNYETYNSLFTNNFKEGKFKYVYYIKHRY